jgi:hypothetical protein
MSTQATLGSASNVSATATNSDSPQASETIQQHAPPYPLTTYVNNSTHTNPGYSSSYPDALAYVHGYPLDRAASAELEQEIITDAESRAQRSIDGFDEQMEENRTAFGGDGRLEDSTEREGVLGLSWIRSLWAVLSTCACSEITWFGSSESFEGAGPGS